MYVHHAVVFEGERAPALAAARAYVRETLAVSLENNPDFYLMEAERLTIDDTRALIDRAWQQPFGAKQVFMVAVDGVMRESQNALLKLLEDPTPFTHFVLVVPSVSQLLPTVRSRIAYGGRSVDKPSEYEHAVAFLRADTATRNSLIRPIVGEKDRKSDRVRARSFVQAIELCFHAEPIRHKQALADVALVQSYLGDRSSSVKMLLEYLASALPVVR